MSTGLKGKVALVTGASRGIGRGTALELGSAGVTVYITGRLPAKSDNSKANVSSTLEHVAAEVTQRGGKGIAVHCDHSNPEDVRRLFERIDREQNGQLDILVNNVLAGVYWMYENMDKKFWEYKESPAESWETINNVGLKNHFVCSSYAAKLMVKRKTGLIINISSAATFNYVFGVLYSLGSASLARMAADMSRDLEGTGVHAIALWPGWVQTEVGDDFIKRFPNDPYNKYLIENQQSVYYPGRAITLLAQSPDLLKKYNGKSVTTTEFGDEHNVLDLDGKTHPDPIVYKYKDFLDHLNKVYLDNWQMELKLTDG